MKPNPDIMKKFSSIHLERILYLNFVFKDTTLMGNTLSNNVLLNIVYNLINRHLVKTVILVTSIEILRSPHSK